MLSYQEETFIRYWEANRLAYSSFASKLSRGLPMATIFTLPILLFILVVYFFFPQWYTKVSAALPGALFTIIIALVIAIFFFAYFRMHFKWEMNEQLYQELLSKQHKPQAAQSA